MAESMLLLAFCLLLVAAAIIAGERDKAAKAIEELTAAHHQISALESLVSNSRKDIQELNEQVTELARKLALARGSVKDLKQLEKEWRELVQARDTLRFYEEQELSPTEIAELKQTIQTIQAAGFSTENNLALDRRLQQLLELENKRENARPHEWPPIINLSEAGGYFFRSGSAELTGAFADKLRGSIANEIAENLQRYQVDVIEVIGHTDEQPISRASSNLDQEIIDVVEGEKPVTEIIPADNAGLGMARALAVVNVLKRNNKLEGTTILPMSGAQLVLPGDLLTTGQAGDVESRRRIEIRIRRRNDASAQ
jgi:flagellar motor protein MotB